MNVSPQEQRHRTSRIDTSPASTLFRIVYPELEGDVTDMQNRHSKALNFENTIPDDWRKSVIVSLPKKGNSTALDNQRVIAKTCSSAKLFNKVLLSRLKTMIDPQLSQCHSGFRAGRSTTDGTEMRYRYVQSHEYNCIICLR